MTLLLILVLSIQYIGQSMKQYEFTQYFKICIQNIQEFHNYYKCFKNSIHLQMEQLVKQKIQNLKRLASLYNSQTLVSSLNEAQKRSFASVQEIQYWFKTALNQDKNRDLVNKWKNIIDRMQIYRDVWKDLKKDKPEEVIEIQKVLITAESKLDFLGKDELVQLTTKVTLAVMKQPKFKELKDELKSKVQEMANAKKDKQKDKRVGQPKQSQPMPQLKEPSANQISSTNYLVSQKPSQPIQSEKKPSILKNSQVHSSSKPQQDSFPNQIKRAPIIPKKEDKKQEAPRIPQTLVSYSDIRVQKPPVTHRYKPFTNPHDQIKAIYNKLSSSGPLFSKDTNNLALKIKNQLNLYMKGILVKLIKLASINNPQNNQDQFSYFSKKNQNNSLFFSNRQFSLQQKLPKRDRFFKVVYPHKLQIYSALRKEEQDQQQRLRIQDKRKRKEIQRQIFEFVRGEPRSHRTHEFKQENTRFEKLMIKLTIVQTMMEMDPYYSSSHILHMSYYI